MTARKPWDLDALALAEAAAMLNTALHRATHRLIAVDNRIVSTLDESVIDSWLSYLALEMPTRTDSHADELSLPAIAEELGLWAKRAPGRAWRRAGNARSLRNDLLRTVSLCGLELTALIADEVKLLHECLNAVHREAKRHRGDPIPFVPGVAQAVERLSGRLKTAEARVASWNDLVSAARDPAPDAQTVKAGIVLLTALLDLAGIDPSNFTFEIHRMVGSSSILPGKMQADDGSPHAPQNRLVWLRDKVAAEPKSGHCVVWLTYDNARTSTTSAQRIGPATFYDVPWAVPNALKEDGQEFADREELRVALEYLPELRNYDGARGRSYEVIGRVDLGSRPVYRAFEDARAMVDTILGVTTNRTGGAAWNLIGPSCLMVDGRVAQSRGRFSRRIELVEPDHYGQNATASALASHAEELGALLSIGTLPPDLAEALRLIKEAGQLDSRENALLGTATIAQQTAVVLQVSALEHLETFAGTEGSDLSRVASRAWSRSQWRLAIAQAINRGLYETREHNDSLAKAIDPSSSRHWSFTAAYDHRDALTERISNPGYRTQAARVLESIGDADLCAQMMSENADKATVLDDRLARARNSLVHGNFVTARTVATISDFSRYKTSTALEFAIRSVVEGVSLEAVVQQERASQAAESQQLSDGESKYEHWINSSSR